MASNPYKPSNSAVHKPNRNSLDLSFTNNLTFDFGQLIPGLCLETLPGDSYVIDAAMALRAMPLAFPIQTKSRVHVHFFYQRLKNLWKDFPDFIYGNDKLQNKTIVPPYIDFGSNVAPNGNRSLLQTCSLGDYLGLPTVAYNSRRPLPSQASPASFAGSAGERKVWTLRRTGNPVYFPDFPTSTSGLSVPSATDTYIPSESTGQGTDQGDDYQNRNRYGILPFSSYLEQGHQKVTIDVPMRFFTLDPSTAHFLVTRNAYTVGSVTTPASVQYLGIASYEIVNLDLPTWGTSPCYRFTFEFDCDFYGAGLICLCATFSSASNVNPDDSPLIRVEYSSPVLQDAVNQPQGSILTNKQDFLISALPFRCYESIYNSFYRDNRNNPLMLPDENHNNQPVYNKYLPTDGSGADSTPYSLYNRNWEYDHLTSAVRSPQQGTAPLVGISSLGEVTFAYEGKEYTFGAETADDADTITKINVTENIPEAVSRSIVNAVTSGISINDFRNVNAFQRWLETNIRRGLKYKDQTLARWGVTPSDASLDMPEFIGGFSVDVDINTVTNTNGDGSAPLGDYAANATAFGGSKHKIRHFCDQHGFIMAIVSVVPTPVYSQLLSKKFLRRTALDYYSPEFGQIGMQAIPYAEIDPLGCRRDQNDTGPLPTDVFGYQRPWYDYLSNTDEAHGLFRTDFNQFLLSRTFGVPPTLGPDFLTVHASSLNDVFTVKNHNNLLGMIRFNIEAKRPIPAVSVPSL